jgi:two-component system, OmpR family, sensor histidine kinase VicK
MLDLLKSFSSTWAFIPHEHCDLWQTNLIWLHIISDGLITLADYSIPVMLVYFNRQRSDNRFKGIIWLFSAFILGCGTTHAFEIWTLWHPAFWISGGLKAITAIISSVTAIALFSLIPKALAMPSRDQLEASNLALTQEVEERKRIEVELQHRLDFDQLVARYSTQFIQLDSQSLSSAIEQALEDLAGFMGVEHCFLFKVTPSEETFSLTHAWATQDFIPPRTLIEIPYAALPWGMTQLLSGQVLNLSSIAQLDLEQSQDQTFWQDLRIKSVIGFPLHIQGIFLGWLGFASYTHEQEWSEQTVQLLKMFSEMLTHTLHREQVEIDRRHAQAQLQNLFSKTPSLNCTAGLDGYFQLLSPSFCNLLGYPMDELLKHPFLDFVHPEDQALTLAEVENLSRGSNTIGFENRYRCQNGDYRWLSWHSTAILEDQTIYATAVDITERKQEQMELTQKNRSLKLLADLTLQIRQSRQIDEVLQQTAKGIQEFLQTDRVLVLQLTPAGCLARAESVLPEQSKIVGQEFLDPCFATEYVDKYQDGTPAMIVDVSTADIHDCHRDLLQTLNVKSNVIAPIFQQDEIWGLLIAHQCDAPRCWQDLEVDLLKQVADQISVGLAQWQLLNQLEGLVEERTAAFLRSESQFRSLFAAAPDLIYILNPMGLIQTVNPAVIDTLGFSEQELLQHPLPELLTPDCQALCKQGFQDLGDQGVHRQEMNLHCKNGSMITVDCSCKLVNTDDDPFILVLQRDISKQKAIEALKDEFVSVVSHELRTPLTSIHGSLKLLGTGNLGDLSSQGTQVLQIALRNTDRLSRLINDVLDLERIESGRVVMSKQHCNVSDLMIQATQDMQSMAMQNQVMLRANQLDCGVFADADHITQTLTNLLSNAIKFSSLGGQVYLTASVQGQDVLFEVRDQGRGIPQDKLMKIFERFQQVDVSDARQKGGTGLGLAICQQIIERHGGKIWAESEEGKGSCFYFTLPKSTD